MESVAQAGKHGAAQAGQEPGPTGVQQSYKGIAMDGSDRDRRDWVRHQVLPRGKESEDQVPRELKCSSGILNSIWWKVFNCRAEEAKVVRDIVIPDMVQKNLDQTRTSIQTCRPDWG